MVFPNAFFFFVKFVKTLMDKNETLKPKKRKKKKKQKQNNKKPNTVITE